jgi:hypothetical protein
VLFIVAGAGGIAVALLRLSNDIEYLPNDVRSQPWFDPAVSAVMVVWSLLFLVVGVVRFLRAARSRPK